MKIPNGNESRSLSSKNGEDNQYKNLTTKIPDGSTNDDKDNEEESPNITYTGIYKKVVCPPHTELPTVIKKTNDNGSNESNSTSSAYENAVLSPENIKRISGPVFASVSNSYHNKGSSEFNLMPSAYENALLPSDVEQKVSSSSSPALKS